MNFETKLRELAALPERAGNDYHRIMQALDEMRSPFTSEAINLLADVLQQVRNEDNYFGGVVPIQIKIALAALDAHHAKRETD